MVALQLFRNISVAQVALRECHSNFYMVDFYQFFCRVYTYSGRVHGECNGTGEESRKRREVSCAHGDTKKPIAKNH